MPNSFSHRLWRRWVAANALGELVGLGATFAIIGLLYSRFEPAQNSGPVLLTFLLAVLSGSFEATVIGAAQWWAMRPWFPAVRLRAWWLATLAGALLAYVLGFLPSTLMDLGQVAAETPAPVTEPPQWVVLLLAAALGAVAGAVLSSAQWLALRGKAYRPGRWVPANMLAWAAGMPIIFAGIDLAQMVQPPYQMVLIIAGALLLAGALVGAIHGVFLIRMVPASRQPD
jgi:hypothetical protein